MSVWRYANWVFHQPGFSAHSPTHKLLLKRNGFSRRLIRVGQVICAGMPMGRKAAGFPVSSEALRMSQVRHRCQVCRHPEKWRLELLRAGGASLDSLAEKFGLDRDSIHRHWHNHVSAEMKASYLCGPSQLAELAEKAAAEGDSVLDYLRMIRTVLSGQLAVMTEAGDGRGAAYVAGRLTATLETMARITGEIGALARSTINTTGTLRS